MVKSVFVAVSVLWIKGSCTCSPAPQPNAGSNPASGSEVGPMATTTEASWSSPSADTLESACERESAEQPHKLPNSKVPASRQAIPFLFMGFLLSLAKKEGIRFLPKADTFLVSHFLVSLCCSRAPLRPTRHGISFLRLQPGKPGFLPAITFPKKQQNKYTVFSSICQERGRLGKLLPVSNLAATARRWSTTGRCWGQAFSHWRQPMHALAFPCFSERLL